MADLRGSDCLSVEECTVIFQDYSGLQLERRLVGKAAVKESDIVEKIAYIMDRHFPSSEEARKLKGILKIDVLNLTLCIFCVVCADFYPSVVVCCVHFIYDV